MVTNLPRKTHKRVDVLKIYKYQPYVERRFENLKTEYALAPAYLKKPLRIVGLVHAHFLALMVGALMEREIRSNMKAKGVDSIPLYPEQRDCKAPTTPRILELFDRVEWFRHVGRKEAALYPVQLTELQVDVLRLLGVPKTLYELGQTQAD